MNNAEWNKIVHLLNEYASVCGGTLFTSASTKIRREETLNRIRKQIEVAKDQKKENEFTGSMVILNKIYGWMSSNIKKSSQKSPDRLIKLHFRIWDLLDSYKSGNSVKNSDTTDLIKESNLYMEHVIKKVGSRSSMNLLLLKQEVDNWVTNSEKS